MQAVKKVKWTCSETIDPFPLTLISFPKERALFLAYCIFFPK